MLEIKRYIDENFQAISSTSDISDHFFYSREYISRMFKQYFNTNISEYITHKRIDAAKEALEAGQTVTQAFNASGYRSMSSFILSIISGGQSILSVTSTTLSLFFARLPE